MRMHGYVGKQIVDRCIYFRKKAYDPAQLSFFFSPPYFAPDSNSIYTSQAPVKYAFNFSHRPFWVFHCTDWAIQGGLSTFPPLYKATTSSQSLDCSLSLFLSLTPAHLDHPYITSC